MNDRESKPLAEPQDPEDGPSPGPNLVLIYTLMALAFLAAMAIAALIVLPYYRSR